MNSYTLTFNSPRFENLYRKKQHDKEYQIYKFNFRFVIIMIALTIIRSLLVIDYLKVFLLVLFMAGVIIIQYLARKSYNFMDFSMFII